MKSFKILIIILSALSLSLSESRELKCVFSLNFYDDYDQYDCMIENQDFDDFNITFDTSGHEVGKSNNDVIEVYIKDSKISHLPNGMFVIFPNLQNLFLDNTYLKQWKREYLRGARNLTNLYILKNDIESFDDDAFAEVPQLESLRIEENKIKFINPNIFKVFSELSVLDLQNNDFSTNLPLGVFDAVKKTLVYLNLQKTKMTKVPVRMFKNFQKLQELTLSYNFNLEVIDASLTFPDTLKEVYTCEM